MNNKTQHHYLRPVTFERGDAVILFCLTIAVILACVNIHSILLSCVMLLVVAMQPEVCEHRGLLSRNTWRTLQYLEQEAMDNVGSITVGRVKIVAYIVMVVGCVMFGMYLGFAALIFEQQGFSIGCFAMLFLAFAFFYGFSYFPWKSM